MVECMVITMVGFQNIGRRPGMFKKVVSSMVVRIVALLSELLINNYMYCFHGFRIILGCSQNGWMVLQKSLGLSSEWFDGCQIG